MVDASPPHLMPTMITQIEQPKREVDQENTQERPSTEKDLNHIRQEDVLYHHQRTSDPGTLIQETADDPRSFKREPFATQNYDEFERRDPCPSFSHGRTLSSDTSASYHTAHSQRSSPELQSGYDQEMALETTADRPCCKCYVQA